jgi:hypothetical protein
LIEHPLKVHRLLRPYFDQCLYGSLNGQGDTGIVRRIALDSSRFLDVPLKTFEIEFQRYFSLASGRDYPVETGNSAPSAWRNIVYMQGSLSAILHDKIMRKRVYFRNFSEIEIGIRDGN